MSRLPNVIYVRAGRLGGYDAFAKALGEGIIVACQTRAEAIRRASLVLWAINRYGPEHYEERSVEEDPDLPKTFEYPVIDEL